MNAALQWLVVGLLLAWSGSVMLARLFPATAATLRSRLAALAEHQGRPRLAVWLRAVPAAGGCDSGCGSCKSGCGTPVAPRADTPAPVPVQWRP